MKTIIFLILFFSTSCLGIDYGILKELEGFSPRPYSDHGQTSIGYGTDKDFAEKVLGKRISTITRAESDKVLRERVNTEIDSLRKELPGFDGYPECVRESLVCVRYNCPELIGPNVKSFCSNKDWKGLQKEIAFGFKDGNLYGLVVRHFKEANNLSSITGVTLKVPKNLQEFRKQKGK